MGYFLAFCVLWLSCGIIASGLCNAYFRVTFPTVWSKHDWWFSLVWGMSGGIVACIMMTIEKYTSKNKYTWSLSRKAIPQKIKKEKNV